MNHLVVSGKLIYTYNIQLSYPSGTPSNPRVRTQRGEATAYKLSLGTAVEKIPELTHMPIRSPSNSSEVLGTQTGRGSRSNKLTWRGDHQSQNPNRTDPKGRHKSSERRGGGQCPLRRRRKLHTGGSFVLSYLLTVGRERRYFGQWNYICAGTEV